MITIPKIVAVAKCFLMLLRLLNHINVIPFLFAIPPSCCTARIRFCTENTFFALSFFVGGVLFCWCRYVFVGGDTFLLVEFIFNDLGFL